MQIRTFSYGCGKVKEKEITAILDQATLGRRLKYQLWQLSMAKREAYREFRRQLFPELVEAEALLSKSLELISILNEDKQNLKLQLKIEITKSKKLKGTCASLRDKAKDNPDLKEKSVYVTSKHKELVRSLRKVYVNTLGLYSHFFDDLVAAANAASSGKEDPKKPKKNKISLTLNLAKNGSAFTKNSIMCSSNNYIRIVPPQREGKGKQAGSRTRLYYRIGSNPDKSPVWADLPLMLHRDLPEDSQIKRVQLVVEYHRVARWELGLRLYLKSNHNHRKGEGAGIAAVLFKDDGLVWRCEYGQENKLDMTTYLSCADRLRGLQAVRDNKCNEVCSALAGWLDRQDDSLDWVRYEIEQIQEKRSCRMLYRAVVKLLDHTEPKMKKYLKAWMTKENHLYAWCYDARRNLIRSRNDMYWRLGAELRSKFRTVLLDDRKLEDPVRKSYNANIISLGEARSRLRHSLGDSAVACSGITLEELFTNYHNKKVVS